MNNFKIRLAEDLALVIGTLELAGMRYSINADKMAIICRDMFGNRDLSKFFDVEKSEVLPTLERYISRHEY